MIEFTVVIGLLLFILYITRSDTPPSSNIMTSQELRDVAASCWCTPQTSHIRFNPLLAEAIADILAKTQNGTLERCARRAEQMALHDYAEWCRRQKLLEKS